MKKINPLTRAKKQKALALLEASQFVAAAEILEKICKTDPRDGEAWGMLGTAYLHLGSHQQAVTSLARAVNLLPDRVDLLFNLGIAQRAAGETDAAIKSYREALRRHPGLTAARSNLGIIYEETGRLAEAIECFREAGRHDPTNAEASSNLGKALLLDKQFEAAVVPLQHAVALKPTLFSAHLNLGAALSAVGDNAGSESAYRRAVELDPSNFAAHENLAKELFKRARYDEALNHLRLRLKYSFDSANPDVFAAICAYLFSLNAVPNLSAEALFAEHRQWGQKLGARIVKSSHHPNIPDIDHRLRVGYVSPDFRRHSVAHFIEPILRNHDAERFEVFCYSNVSDPDHVTEQLRRLAPHWRSIVDLEDKAVAEQIRRDGIDILIDLAGYTVQSRLPVFACEPAPVQITYLGYPNTTGLSAMNYRITDMLADPPGQEAYHTEQLVRLPCGFLCYQPPADAPMVPPPPLMDSNAVTFGSFNALHKINTDVVALWARLLRTRPASRLIIKNSSLRDPKAVERYRKQFEEQGIDSDRIELLGWLKSSEEHLSLYQRIDISLDTFPYNGTTTTCEALWMGVPVVTLAGDRHAGRVGVSLLTRVGLPELIAETPDDYVRIATKLADNTERLAELRRSLRGRMAASPLCDAEGFTRQLESAYREMWRTWCESR